MVSAIALRRQQMREEYGRPGYGLADFFVTCAAPMWVVAERETPAVGAGDEMAM